MPDLQLKRHVAETRRCKRSQPLQSHQLSYDHPPYNRCTYAESRRSHITRPVKTYSTLYIYWAESGTNAYVTIGTLQGDGGKAEMIVHDDRSLLALQGPKAMEVLQPHTDTDLSKLYFSNFVTTKIGGFDCFLTRTG